MKCSRQSPWPHTGLPFNTSAAIHGPVAGTAKLSPIDATMPLPGCSACAPYPPAHGHHVGPEGTIADIPEKPDGAIDSACGG